MDELSRHKCMKSCGVCIQTSGLTITIYEQNECTQRLYTHLIRLVDSVYMKTVRSGMHGTLPALAKRN
ncbi:hypothetical protein L596_001762 [Steinernema carpocapsae]|uniref:Uncharacterized protein n=1 Tax=Steinernema carpocapsae TaxID=34508 RepID=A0A4U8UP87_STECR|nr:hypothetical protein L596_001762 [Steinernema carpocapsae]